MKSFFGREFIINIPGVHTMLLDEDTELQKLCDKVLSKEEGISSLVCMLRNNFQTLSRRSNRVRELISNGVNTLAEQYTSINDRIIRNHVLHDSDQVGYNTRWEDIVNMLEVYHHIQINFIISLLSIKNFSLFKKRFIGKDRASRILKTFWLTLKKLLFSLVIIHFKNQ